jgi:hypothetical protein
VKWTYYENLKTGYSWIVPSRVSDIIIARPKFVAESDSGVKIGIFGRREYLANFVYQHSDCCIYFYIGARFKLGISSLEAETNPANEGFADLIVGDIHAKALLTDEERRLFLESTADPSVYNHLFKMCEYDLHTEVRSVRLSKTTDGNLKKKPWVKE